MGSDLHGNGASKAAGAASKGPRTGSPVRVREGADEPGGKRNQAYLMPDLRQLQQEVITTRRAYSTLHRAVNALPLEHPATQPLERLVAVAAKHWHEARLRLDAARATAKNEKQAPEGG
jgi:hypothetical protein